MLQILVIEKKMDLLVQNKKCTYQSFKKLNCTKMGIVYHSTFLIYRLPQQKQQSKRKTKRKAKKMEIKNLKTQMKMHPQVHKVYLKCAELIKYLTNKCAKYIPWFMTVTDNGEASFQKPSTHNCFLGMSCISGFCSL